VTRREEIQQWKKSGADLLAQAEADLAEKLAEIELLKSEADGLRADIAEMRAALPRSAPRAGEPATAASVLQTLAAVSESPTRAVRVATGATVIDIVRAVLAASDEPIPSKAVIDFVRVHRQGASAKDVHRALNRLKKARKVEVSGTRPNSLYALKEANGSLPLAS
jgi:hypothetical protein